MFLWKDLPKTESVEDRFSLDSFDLEKRPAIESRKMLWVIGKDECVYAKERGFFGKACSRKRLSHTNLTGAEMACVGGEMWVDDAVTRVVMNGGSSRYRARNLSELEDACKALSAEGVEVECMGWNEEQRMPERVYRKAMVLKFSQGELQ